jgi:DNA-directed RNA polymerase specialized sigma24 family protein
LYFRQVLLLAVVSELQYHEIAEALHLDYAHNETGRLI